VLFSSSRTNFSSNHYIKIAEWRKPWKVSCWLTAHLTLSTTCFYLFSKNIHALFI
jgi:hypothetical protein